MSDREDVRELLRELLKETLANGDGREATVPPPPVAAVLRPSTWSRPPAPGEVIGDGGASRPRRRAEHRSRIESDADLDGLRAARCSIRATRSASGRLRFTLGAGRRARASCASSTAR